MAIEHDKFIFCHCPKTGGTSIKTHLRKLFEKDALVENRSPHSWPSQHTESKFKFTFIRDPWDWLASWYQTLHDLHAIPDSVTYHPLLWFAECQYGTCSFEVFVDDMLGYCPDRINEIFKLYTRGADYVGHTDTLEKDLYQALTLSKALAFQRANRSNVLPKYDPSLARQVRQAYETHGGDPKISTHPPVSDSKFIHTSHGGSS